MHRYDIPLSPAAQSRARYSGRKVGEAIHREDFATARLEYWWYRRFQHGLTDIQRSDQNYLYDLARRDAILAR